MFVMLTDELFLGFETICSNFTGIWYGQEQLGCTSLLRALVWAGTVGIYFTIDSARKLQYKYLCSRHFSEGDFTTAERVHLNRVALPSASDSATQSLPQPPYLVKRNVRFSIAIVFL
jgi:hypothetical protein